MSAAQGGGSGDAGRAAQERLTEEARATASALLDWLGSRVDVAPGGGTRRTTGSAATGPTTGTAGSRRARLGMRPPQSPGPCAWCPICALVAALRGEQPELTTRFAEQASGLMMLLRLMVQAHQDPAHGTSHGVDHEPGPWPAQDAHDAATPPPGWPAEWGAWDGWSAGPEDPGPGNASPPGGGADGPGRTGAGAGSAGIDGKEPATDDLTADVPAGRGHRAAPGPGTAPAERTAGPASEVRPHRRRVPVRRASPRSAAFRDTTGDVAGTGPDTAGTGPGTAETVRGPTGTAGSATPGTARTSPPSPRPAPPSAPGGTPTRASVQRIAIRRPAHDDGRTRGDDASC